MLQPGNASKGAPDPLVDKTAMTDIALRFEPPFARIVLNRPDRRNAISRAMWRALPAIRAAIEAREDTLVALVEGEGAAFQRRRRHF